MSLYPTVLLSLWSRKRSLVRLLALAPLCASVRAQPALTESAASGASAPASTSEDRTVTLSPFTVQASSDVGYESSNTLSGTGLNAKITDLGSSITVVTGKFLQDTQSRDFKDFLIYQGDVEVKGFGGNLSGAVPVLGGITTEPSLSNSDASIGTRVRGLADATLARNYYRTIIPMDSYNTERVDINRGANALLFGVGSPAGIINTSTKDASLAKTSAQGEIYVDSYGSLRTAGDANVAVDHQLAIRADAVRDEEKYEQKFAYRNGNRGYVAGEWDVAALRRRGIFTSTILKGSYETGKYTSNNPRVLTPVDKVSTWFPATLTPALVALGATAKASYDPTVGPFNTFTPALGNATLGVPANVNRSPTFFFQSPYATAPRDNVPTNSAGQVVLGRPIVSNNVYYPSTGLTGIAVEADSLETVRALQNYSLPNSQFYTSQNFSDPSFFDFFHKLLDGPNSQAIDYLHAGNVSLQQLFLGGKAGVELSLDKQHWDESLQSVLSESTPYISIDVNTKLWTGEANPNFGRPFVATAGSASYVAQDLETLRAKLFFSWDFQDYIKNSTWASILGRHVISFLDQRETQRQDSRTGGTMFYTPDTWTNGNNQSRGAAQSKQIVSWVYIGPSLANANTPFGARVTGVQANLMNFQNQVNGQGVVITRVPAPSAGVANQPAYNPTYTGITVNREDRLADHTATAATLSQSILDGRAVAMQSNWLDDHLVSTFGFRRESSSALSVNAPADPSGQSFVVVSDPSYSRYNPTLVRQVYAKTLNARSIVAKTPVSWLKHVPAVTALNVYYDSSEDFTPPTARSVNPFGDPLAPPSGRTKEEGLYLEGFQGKVSLRVNFFKTTQDNSINTTVGGLAATIVSLHTQVFNLTQSGSLVNSGNGFPPTYTSPPQALLDLFHFQVVNGVASSTNPGVADTSDYKTKGTELELGFRPTAGLSFLMNAAEQNSVTADTGAATGRLLFNTPTSTGKSIAQEWTSPWAYQIPLNAGALNAIGSTTNINILAVGFQTSVLNVYNSAVARDGSVATDLRKWRANFVGNYEFQNHLLRGFAIGGAVRWQDRVAIGYPLTTLNGLTITDVRHPFYGTNNLNVDGWISYHTTLWKGRVGLKTQLGLRNIAVHDKLLPVAANPDGSIAVWSISESMKFISTTTFSFWPWVTTMGGKYSRRHFSEDC